MTKQEIKEMIKARQETFARLQACNFCTGTTVQEYKKDLEANKKQQDKRR